MEQNEKKHDIKKKKKKKGSSSDEPSTCEEKFIESALATVQLHAKAKMLVHDMVTKIKEDEAYKALKRKSKG